MKPHYRWDYWRRVWLWVGPPPWIDGVPGVLSVPHWPLVDSIGRRVYSHNYSMVIA